MSKSKHRPGRTAFIVSWESEPPENRLEWISVVRDVVDSSAGSYRIRFWQEPKGWRFDLEQRLDLGEPATDVIVNTSEAVRFNLHYVLWERGFPIDPDWKVPNP